MRFRKHLLVFLLLLAPTVVFGARMRLFEVRTGNRFVFDVMAESSMGMSNGLNDAYDGCYMLRVAGIEARTPSVTILFGGRAVQSPRTPVGSFEVSRQLYVPTAGDWARYYDLITNTTNSPQTAEVEIYGNLGSDGSTKVTHTSDGDLTIETTDTWFGTDDFDDGSGDPSLAHVFRRQTSKLSPAEVSLDGDDLSVRFRLKMGPRSKAAIVFFAVQTHNTTAAATLARELVKFGSKAREHLSPEEIRRIQN